MKIKILVSVAACLYCGLWNSPAEIKVTTDLNNGSSASPEFRFKNLPQPALNDAAAKAAFSLLDGRRDPNGAGLEALHDGKVPADQDSPADNFFFRAGTDGGRLLVDLGASIEIQMINTYSWHASTRGPQVYKIYASDGKTDNFNSKPQKETDPEKCGWKFLAAVDTRPKSAEPGGQHGVSISDTSGSIGKFQFLLFDISRTEDKDSFGNTFFSEFDVIDRDGPALKFVEALGGSAQGARDIVEADGGKYKITIDTSETPELTEWTRKEIAPMVQEWYPKMIKLLPSEGYEAPANFSIVFSKNMQGVAATSGTRIRCAARFIRQNLKGEAKGAIFHEMVHVVQQYGRTRRAANSTRAPGWLTEGITDYLRFYVFEPEIKGAEITKRNLSRARYDASYRVTGNFLNWVTEKHGQDFVPKLNTIIRDGKYNEDQWKNLTGRTVQELGADWKAELEKKLASSGSPASPPVK